MENWNAYMDVLFNLQEIRQIGDSFWLYATVLLLVTAAVILVATCIRKRREMMTKPLARMGRQTIAIGMRVTEM